MDVTLLTSITSTVAGLAAQVTPESLGRPTPCSQWDVGALLAHLTGTNASLGAALGDARPKPADDADYATTARYAVEQFRAFADPHEEVQVGSFGAVPASQLYNMLVTEATTHGWDLAAALGVEYAPDPAAVDIAVRGLSTVGPDARGPGKAFGPVSGDPDAASTPLQRLVILAGRDAAWS
jgi:uncharacterized protein (TIGR03086 family)